MDHLKKFIDYCISVETKPTEEIPVDMETAPSTSTTSDTFESHQYYDEIAIRRMPYHRPQIRPIEGVESRTIRDLDIVMKNDRRQFKLESEKY